MTSPAVDNHVGSWWFEYTPYARGVLCRIIITRRLEYYNTRN